MKLIDFEETKKVELGILKEFADFCEENNLSYFLAYGTLIGAIRHKGFIPWDDDVDVWMPRPDYDKLKELFNSQRKNSNYIVVSPHEKVSRHSIVKIIDKRTEKSEKGVDYKYGVLGVDIDVFPLDGQPEDDCVYEAWYNKLQKIYRRHFVLISQAPTAFIPKMKYMVKLAIIRAIHITKKNILKKAEKNHKKYSYNDSKYVGAVESWSNSRSNRYNKDWFSEAVLVDFEGYKFKAPIGYHEILSKMYGDYMKIPTAEKRVSHHTSKAYWKEDDNEKV